MRSFTASCHNYAKAFISSLPEAWRPCLEDKWIIEDISTVKFELQEEEEFLENYKQKSFINTFMKNATSMEEALQLNGQ